MPNEYEDSLRLAHEYIPLSYDWMLNRMASAEGRVDTLMTQSAAVLVGAVVAVAALNEGSIPWSWPLLAGGAAAAFFFSIIGKGINARRLIRLNMTNPGSFIKKQPGSQPESIAKYAPSELITFMLGEAEKDLENNNATLDELGSSSDAIGLMLVGELLCAVLWAATSPMF